MAENKEPILINSGARNAGANVLLDGASALWLQFINFSAATWPASCVISVHGSLNGVEFAALPTPVTIAAYGLKLIPDLAGLHSVRVFVSTPDGTVDVQVVFGLVP